MNNYDEALINCFIVGKYIPHILSPKELFEGFLSTDTKDLGERYSHSELLRGGRKEHPFNIGIERIRHLFDVNSLIKLLNINIGFYNSEKFKGIVDVDKDSAKSLYEKYIIYCSHNDKIPDDIKLYLPLFDLRLSEQFVYIAFASGDPEVLKDILQYTDIKDIEIVYRHFLGNSFYKSPESLIVSLLDVIYEHGIHVWTHDGTTEKLLKQCNHRNPNKSLWSSASDNDIGFRSEDSDNDIGFRSEDSDTDNGHNNPPIYSNNNNDGNDSDDYDCVWSCGDGAWS